MVESLNSRADYVTTANWMSGGVMGRDRKSTRLNSSH